MPVGKSWSYIIPHFLAIFMENYRWRQIIMGTSNWNSSPFCFRWKACCLSPETYSISFKLDADFSSKTKFKRHIFQRVLEERQEYHKRWPLGFVKLLLSKVGIENWTSSKGCYLCDTILHWQLVTPRLHKDHKGKLSNPLINPLIRHSQVSSFMCRSPLSPSSMSTFGTGS